MKNSQTLAVVLVSLALLICLVCAIPVGVTVVRNLTELSRKPVCDVLICEIDPYFDTAPTPELIRNVVGTLNRRVGRRARAKELGGGQIEVSVFGDDPRVSERIRRLIASSGTLEFRILANSRDHKSLIDQAQAEEKTVVVDSDGEELGRWIPVATNRASSFDYPEIACRTRQVAGKDVLEILVASDPFNVNGSYLKRASQGVDGRGQPCITFQFNSTGGKLFGGLTGNNLPDRVSDFSRKLGIILNGELHSAPAIRSTIFDRGEITGSFTQDEVEDLCAVLNAGSLPAPIRLMDQPDSATSEGSPASQ